jgi:hypothetical protein
MGSLASTLANGEMKTFNGEERGYFRFPNRIINPMVFAGFYHVSLKRLEEHLEEAFL